jgi:hypothetical protein
VLSYVALAVLLSTTISLFWLAALLAAHMALEWWARARRGDRGRTLLGVVWHVKFDLTLVLFALVLGLYFDVLFGLLGVGALARSGTQPTARFVAWHRGLRTLLLTADDAALLQSPRPASWGPGERRPRPRPLDGSLAYAVRYATEGESSCSAICARPCTCCVPLRR